MLQKTPAMTTMLWLYYTWVGFVLNDLYDLSLFYRLHGCGRATHNVGYLTMKTTVALLVLFVGTTCIDETEIKQLAAAA